MRGRERYGERRRVRKKEREVEGERGIEKGRVRDRSRGGDRGIEREKERDQHITFQYSGHVWLSVDAHRWSSETPLSHLIGAEMLYKTAYERSAFDTDDFAECWMNAVL